MNNEQMKYAKQRLQELYSTKKNALTVRFSTVGVKLTTEEKITALKTGEFTVLDKPVIDRNSYYEQKWTAYIKFNAETPAEKDVEGLKAAEAALKEKYTAAMDELMLGDSEEAIRLIKAFEQV